MNILVLNCGSSSVKFQIIETDLDLIEQDRDRRLAGGIVERIGSQGLMTFQAEGQAKVKQASPIKDHGAAIDAIVRWIVSKNSNIKEVSSLADIHAVGHRVVHGGERFKASVRISDKVIGGIEDCIELAPLHNPANVKGIRATQSLLGDAIPQVAVFDTSFHSTMPESSFIYGIPYQFYRRYKIRRYGFHGTSHRYVAYRYRLLKKIPREQVNIISLHLGNGCSACAIKNGESFVTSMGFTPLEGLLMGTRSGDVDGSILDYLSHKEGLSLQEMDVVLNKQSGLLGVSGLTSDMRELLAEESENQDRRAKLAIDIFCQRVKRYIGGYLAEMAGASAVVFTAGIGENSPAVRERICKGLEGLGIILDPEMNKQMHAGKVGVISTPDSKIELHVISTNEELLIARDTVRVVKNVARRW